MLNVMSAAAATAIVMVSAATSWISIILVD